MPNVTRKNGDQPTGNQPGGNQPQTQRGSQAELVRRPDPMQMQMQRMMREPFQLMRDFLIDPLSMFQTTPFRGFGGEMTWNPTFEVRETDDGFVFKGDLPGIKNADLEISLTGNRLEVSGKRDYENESNEGTLHMYERSYGNFSRTFSLPESADLDKIRTELEDGVLTMIVPKKEGSSPQSRKIQIGSGSKS